MARIAEEELERLKREVSLLDRVRAAGIELKRHGANWLGRCPFHDDQTPSLVITPGKNLWHCLGACQTGGSVLDWEMRRHGLSFRHAAERLRAELREGIPGGGAAGRAAWQALALGSLGGGISTARAIAEDGAIVGWSTTSGANGPLTAFLWQLGTMTDLGSLGAESQALGIATGPAGRITVGGSTVSGSWRPVRWRY